jgi:homoserine trans-succinylase
LFIDERNNGYTDFAEITQKLKAYLNGNTITQRKWADVDMGNQMKRIVALLRRQEKKLLPWKKKRALNIAEGLLKQRIERKLFEGDEKEKAEKLLTFFKTEFDTDDFIDFDHFADLWLTILIPALDTLKRAKTQKRKIYTLRDLNIKNTPLTGERLDWILANCHFANTLDEMISACIIGIDKQYNKG